MPDPKIKAPPTPPTSQLPALTIRARSRKSGETIGTSERLGVNNNCSLFKLACAANPAESQHGGRSPSNQGQTWPSADMSCGQGKLCSATIAGRREETFLRVR